MKLYDETNNCWIDHRSLPEYKARKKKLRDYWIFFAALMIFLPAPLVLIFGMFACFVSLMFLDEVPYQVSGNRKVLTTKPF